NGGNGGAGNGSTGGAGAAGQAGAGGSGGAGGAGGAAGAGGGNVSAPPASVLPVPTPEQVAWQRLGLTAFFHFGMNTFTNDEVGDGTVSPSMFNPTGLDA